MTPKRYRALDGTLYVASDDGLPPPELDLRVPGTVEAGHGVASGRGPTSPHPEGSLARQYPFFLELGLDLGRCFPGTLNVSIRPRTFRIVRPVHVFRAVRWTPKQAAETFLIARCFIVHQTGSTAGWVYQPDPATKTVHFDDPSQLQIVAPWIPDVGYGDRVELCLDRKEIELLTT